MAMAVLAARQCCPSTLHNYCQHSMCHMYLSSAPLFSMCLLESKANLLPMIYHSHSSCLLCSFFFVCEVMWLWICESTRSDIVQCNSNVAEALFQLPFSALLISLLATLWIYRVCKLLSYDSSSDINYPIHTPSLLYIAYTVYVAGLCILRECLWWQFPFLWVPVPERAVCIQQNLPYMHRGSLQKRARPS